MSVSPSEQLLLRLNSTVQRILGSPEPECFQPIRYSVSGNRQSPKSLCGESGGRVGMVRYLLVTDIVSLLKDGNASIIAHVASIPPEQVATLLITVEEQLRPSQGLD